MARRQQRQILIIDDCLPTCHYLRRLLEKRGYGVSLAHDGETGAKLAMETLPDMILLDKELPVMHGFAVSSVLRRYHPTSYIPLLMISSGSEATDRIRGLEMGADDFVSKDIAPAELESKINAFLRVKDLQDELRQERDKLNQIFRFLHEPIAICDQDDRILLASQVFLHLFQLPRELMQFRTFTQILQVLQVAPPDIEQLRRGENQQRELHIILDGQPRVLTARAAPILLDQNERLLAYIFEDITQKVADERMKADFHSMIAHDLRSPLSVIQGYVSLLVSGKTGQINAAQQEFLDSIASKITEITALLNDFLDLSKIDAGFVNLNREVVCLGDILREGIVDLSLLAANRGIEIRTELHAGGSQVHGDPLRLKQIMRNLLSNAIKYNIDDGWIEVRTEPLPDQVRVSVSDGGIGISSDEMPLLFVPYQRCQSSGRKVKGVGLGLVIVKKLVEAHGGSVEVTSCPGKGSTFSFVLPTVVPPTSVPPANAHLQEAVQ
jgi:signal transduction histidine kinase